MSERCTKQEGDTVDGVVSKLRSIFCPVLCLGSFSMAVYDRTVMSSQGCLMRRTVMEK